MNSMPPSPSFNGVTCQSAANPERPFAEGPAPPSLRSGGRGGGLPSHSLASVGSLRSVPSPPRPATSAWFADRLPLSIGPYALPLLDHWAAVLRGEARPLHPGWRPEGPGRSPLDAAGLIAYLRARVADGGAFTFNALYWEKQGGRRYPYILPDYDCELPISKNACAAAEHKLLLSATLREVRDLLQLPPGWSRIEGDFKSCHAHIALAISGDPTLAADLAGDIHMVTGERYIAPTVPHDTRRDFGKCVNNRMLYGITPYGIGRLFREFFEQDPHNGWPDVAWGDWWSRYPQLAAFRDWLKTMVAEAQRANRALEIVAPSGRRSRFSAGKVRGVPLGGEPEGKGPEGAFRSIFSAVFRAVEGDLLDRTLMHFHATRDAHGGRLVLPLYDGLIVAAPVGGEAVVWTALEDAGRRAAEDLGIVGLRMARK